MIMKKTKMIVTMSTVLMASILFAGCEKSGSKKNSMSLEDIDHMPMPAAYSYEMFDDSKSIDVGKGNFDSDTEFCDLFPKQSLITKKEILDSQIVNKQICTNMAVYFEDGTKYDVQIDNNPETLELIEADVEKGNGVTIYTYTY